MLIILFFYAIEGFALGVLVAFIDLLSFALSFLAGITFYSVIASVLTKFLPISHGFANALGFFAIAVLVEIVLNIVLKIFVSNVSLFKLFLPSAGPVKIIG